MSTEKIFPSQKIIYCDREEILRMSKTPIINALMKLEKGHRPLVNAIRKRDLKEALRISRPHYEVGKKTLQMANGKQ